MKARATGDFKNNTGGINFNLPVINFQEDGIFFTYTPALDLTGYGKTEDEAKQSFEETLEQFFDYSTKKKTLFSELKNLGWKINKKKIKASPSLVDMLNKNEYLVEIFEQKQYQKQDQTIRIPEIA